MSKPYSHRYLHDILTRTKVIAAVGVSPNPIRPSYFVARYLGFKGYRVIPVNPNETGKKILGERVYATLGDIPEAVDMVDCFRVGSAIGPIAEQAIAIRTAIPQAKAKTRTAVTRSIPHRPKPATRRIQSRLEYPSTGRPSVQVRP